MIGAVLEVRVHAMRVEARDVISMELQTVDPMARLPAFEPGAHIDLHLANGLVRSYSLLDSAAERHYRIGVLKSRDSRGGSRHLHENLRLGDVLKISAPRNNFRLEEHARQSVLVAGGIGVTPLLAMARQLAAVGSQARFIYCARSRLHAAFLGELTTLAATHPGIELQCRFDDEECEPPNLRELLAGASPETHFYCCGPAAMLDAFDTACRTLGYAHTHIERFAPIELPAVSAAQGCVVELRRSGRTIEVDTDASILDSLLAAGVRVDFSCREGICGSCETQVISGDVEHRDSILTRQEQQENKSMFVCVSRCRAGRLVLDL